MTPATTNIEEEPSLYKTENDIPRNHRLELTALLNLRLASAVDLQLQLKQAHWNVKGPNFIGLHELFDKIATTVEAYADQIAERIVELGGIAEGTVRVAAEKSLLDEYPLAIAEGAEHVSAVGMALANFGHSARLTIDEAGALDDADTAMLFSEISRGLDHWLWFVEAHAQSPK